MGVRGTELDRLIEDMHMIAVNKADECIQKEISRHEENKSRVVGQHMKGHNNEKTCEKCKTNKRKVKVTINLGPKLDLPSHSVVRLKTTRCGGPTAVLLCSWK
eukprot:1195974-Prorocentrum_minimum.AAC.3